MARLLADDLRSSLGVEVQVTVVPEQDSAAGARVLVENKLTAPWDVLLFGWFDALFDEMKVQLDGGRLVDVAERIDAMVLDQALALFLCAPQALYAVNNSVSFGPYRTTFEIAEVTVDEDHWSRTGRGVDLTAAAASRTELSGSEGEQVAGYGALPPDTEAAGKPGFSGAAGNAC